MNKYERLGLRATARILEENAYLIDTFKLPLIRKQQDRFIRGTLRNAQTLRVYAGQPKPIYKLIRGKGVVEI